MLFGPHAAVVEVFPRHEHPSRRAGSLVRGAQALLFRETKSVAGTVMPVGIGGR